MRLLPLLLLLSPLALYAEDVAPEVTSTATGWQGMILTLLATLVTAVLLPWIKNKAVSAKAEADVHRFDASKSLLEQKNYLIDARLIPFLWATAAYLTEVRLPQWVDRIVRKDFEGIWSDLLKELKDLAIKKFAGEGIDIVEAIGADALSNLVKRAVMDKLPIPNGIKDPAAFLVDKFLPVMVDKGVKWARDRVTAGHDLPAPVESGAHVSIKPGA